MEPVNNDHKESDQELRISVSSKHKIEVNILPCDTPDSNLQPSFNAAGFEQKAD